MLKEAIALAYGNCFSTAAMVEGENAEDEINVAVPNRKGSESEDRHQVLACAISRHDEVNTYTSIPFTLIGTSPFSNCQQCVCSFRSIPLIHK